MNRPPFNVSHEWHVALNQYNVGDGATMLYWMYEAKRIADEVPRMVYWFKLERTGQMPQQHRQCSHSPTEPIPDNHLTCCLGIECRKCPHLAAVAKADLAPEQIDEIKAWTCAAHILTECGARARQIDTSEGYIKTVDDQMFWERVYSSLAAADRDGV